jgi:uncharacterized protein
MGGHLPSFAQACRNAPRLFGRGLITVYRYTLASLVGFRCRHLPSCSEYADQALERFGLWAGGSGLDFVPEALPEKSRWYMPWRYGRWRGTNSVPSSPSA